jgi:hypothetical protein
MAEILTRHYIKRGDRLPELKGRFLDEATGAPIDLTGATLRLHMQDPETEALLLNVVAAIDGPAADGRFRYAWAAGDTDHPAGGYPFEVEATFSGGRQLTSPNRRNGMVVITEDLG